MNTLTRVFAAVATTLMLGTVSAQAGTPSCNVSSLDARLGVKADQGAAQLRQFVERTKMIYQLNMDSAVERADRARRIEAQCPVVTASR